MEEKTICVSIDEYTNMTFLCGRVKAFEGYLNSSRYGIDPQVAAAILGLELAEESGDE